jgi:hypothetical protein
MQYDTTVNRWHTSKNTARINASNPCSEYMFLDDSACNLASLNLLKFAPNGAFDVEAYRHAVDVLITAQEIIVDNAGYPTEMIGRNSHDYRPLGLGYANLGALLMACGLPYDSDAGRDYAACVTAIMSAVEPHRRTVSPANARNRANEKRPRRHESRKCGWRNGRLARSARWRLPRLLHQSRAVPRRDPHAPRFRQQH